MYSKSSIYFFFIFSFSIWNFNFSKLNCIHLQNKIMWHLKCQSIRHSNLISKYISKTEMFITTRIILNYTQHKFLLILFILYLTSYVRHNWLWYTYNTYNNIDIKFNFKLHIIWCLAYKHNTLIIFNTIYVKS